MKDILFHLLNEELEGLENVVLLFYVHIDMAFCFYIYGPLLVVICDP